MSKLEELNAQHPEMTAPAIVRIEIRKVSDPNLRSALEMIVDLIEHDYKESNDRIANVEGRLMRMVETCETPAPTEPAWPTAIEARNLQDRPFLDGHVLSKDCPKCGGPCQVRG